MRLVRLVFFADLDRFEQIYFGFGSCSADLRRGIIETPPHTMTRNKREKIIACENELRTMVLE